MTSPAAPGGAQAQSVPVSAERQGPWDHGVGRGLHGQLVHQLGQQIVNGEIAEGELIFADRLVEQFSASRSVVRETLRVLESLGMVRARPRVGTRVLPVESWNLMHPQIIRWRGRSPFYREQLRELMQLRAGVEPIAARYAATIMDPAVVEQMRTCCDLMESATATRERRDYVEADATFHRLLLTNCNNRLIAQYVDTVEAVLHTRAEEFHRMFTEQTTAAVGLHRRLVEALGRRDPDGSEHAARVIVDETLEELLPGQRV